MQSHHATAFPIPFRHPLQAISDAWSRAGGWFRTSTAEAAPEPAAADLPAHLRYDLGETDGREPRRQGIAAAPDFQPPTLETMWLRHLR